MPAEGLAETQRLRAWAGKRVIHAPHQEWQRLAEMAENDLQSRISIAYSAEPEPDPLRRRDDRMRPVVHAPRQFDCVGAAESLRRRRAMGQNLHVDACFVHFAQAQLAEIVKPFEDFRIAHTLDTDEQRRQLLVPVVLLQRDHRTVQRSQHDFAPFTSRCLVLAIASGAVTDAAPSPRVPSASLPTTLDEA